MCYILDKEEDKQTDRETENTICTLIIGVHFLLGLHNHSKLLYLAHSNVLMLISNSSSINSKPSNTKDVIIVYSQPAF